MRLEATVPDSRGEAVAQLARRFGLSRSQIIDEALGAFLILLREAEAGNRVVAVDAKTRTERQIVTPTLAQVEWAACRTRTALTHEQFSALVQTLQQPAREIPALRELLDLQA